MKCKASKMKSCSWSTDDFFFFFGFRIKRGWVKTDLVDQCELLVRSVFRIFKEGLVRQHVQNLRASLGVLFTRISLMHNLYTLTSVCIFSILFSEHFLRCWQREFVKQSRAYLVGDHFLYSHDHNVWFRGDIVGRN